MKFSERKGLVSVSRVSQVECMSDSLKNSLWNVFETDVWRVFDVGLRAYFEHLWTDFLRRPRDELMSPYDLMSEFGCEWENDAIGRLRGFYFAWQWYQVYDFLEFTLAHFDDETISAKVNAVLERELSGYRYVAGTITDVTGEQEIAMLEDAIGDEEFPSVAAHLQCALERLSDRKNPDYRNSIKESISAVESIACALTGKPKATLGDALKLLERSGKLHEALRQGFSKLYGYTSDANGIRHAMLEEPDLGPAEAKYFLLSCTSFINYLKSKV